MIDRELDSEENSRTKRQRVLSPGRKMDKRTDPCEALPPETFEHILSFLQPPELTRCALVSRSWSAFCNHEALWRALAMRLGYCQLERSAEERHSGIRVVASVLQQFDSSEPDDLLQATIERYRSRNVTDYFEGCDSWRSLCCLLWRLNCNWSARIPSGDPRWAQLTSKAMGSWHGVEDWEQAYRLQQANLLPPELALFPGIRTLHSKPQGSGTWRCKLDPEEQTLITTGEAGGIQVLDIRSKTLLWHIPKTATRSHPHLEFSRGWMVFDRQGLGHFEVWRSERLVPDLGRQPDRGHYQRFTILDSVRPIRAYRFQFPYLCAASQDGFIVIWDVPQKRVVETINFQHSPHRDGNINYVEFDNDFVFLLGIGAKSVSVFSRSSQEMVWNLGEHFASGAPPPTTWRPTYAQGERIHIGGRQPFLLESLERTHPGPWQAGPNTMNLAQLTMTPYQIWSAVHPDHKTKTLLILGQGTVLFIRDYKKFFDNSSRSPELFFEIEFEDLEEAYKRLIRGQEDWSAEGWNNIRLWQSRGQAQLTVHEGKACIINHVALIIDLDPHVAAQHRIDRVKDLTDDPRAPNTQDGEASLPEEMETPSPGLASRATSVSVGTDGDPLREREDVHQTVPPVLMYREAFPNTIDSYEGCSSLQMDATAIYLTADRSVDDLFDDVEIGEWSGEDRVLLRLGLD